MSNISPADQRLQDSKTLHQLAYFVAGFMVFTAAMAIGVNIFFG